MILLLLKLLFYFILSLFYYHIIIAYIYYINMYMICICMLGRDVCVYIYEGEYNKVLHIRR